MFNCAVCRETIGPNVKPARVVTGIRRVSYHNEYFVEDDWGNKQKREVDSDGTEITGEQLVCLPCAGEEPSKAPSLERIGGVTFREKPADPLRVKVIASVVQNMLARLDHKSARAKRDTEFAIPGIKAFVDENKDLRF